MGKDEHSLMAHMFFPATGLRSQFKNNYFAEM